MMRAWKCGSGSASPFWRSLRSWPAEKARPLPLRTTHRTWLPADAVSAAKAHVGRTLMLVANEAIQMHGGIGMTDDHDVGFYLKRARVAQFTLGDARYHCDYFTRLRGF